MDIATRWPAGSNAGFQTSVFVHCGREILDKISRNGFILSTDLI
jgi:hypothetical protein